MSEAVSTPREPPARVPVSPPEGERPAPAAVAPKEAEQSKKESDPMLDLLDKLAKVSAVVAARDPGMAKGLNQIVEQSTEPGRTEQPLFRTQVAYMLQDVEKLASTTAISVPPELRAELSKLAATSPGLENRQMEALVRGTPDIDDRSVIRDVRRAAATVAALGDQNSPQVKETIEVLENRMRLASRFSAQSDISAGPATEPFRPVSADRPAAAAEPAAGGQRSGEAPGGPGPESDSRPKEPGTLERVRTVASPGDDAIGGVATKPVLEGQRSSASPMAVNSGDLVASAGKPKGFLSSMMDNARPQSGRRSPWEPPPINMKLRVASFEETMANGRTDQHIRAAEKSGVALMQSMETFMGGPGAGVLGKIEAAASTEPGGIKAVMSEMQPGGRYASLRSEFDNALQQDRVFAASFNAVEKAAGQYGQDRLTLASDFQARKLDAGQLDARFQRADAAIGEAAEKIPGRGAGQNVMAEMAEKVSEMLSKAVDRVRQMFSKETEAGPKASSSPGMSP